MIDAASIVDPETMTEYDAKEILEAGGYVNLNPEQWGLSDLKGIYFQKGKCLAVIISHYNEGGYLGWTLEEVTLL